jgi:hypothetical protein
VPSLDDEVQANGAPVVVLTTIKFHERNVGMLRGATARRSAASRTESA